MLSIILEKALNKALQYNPDLAEKCRTLGEKDVLVTIQHKIKQQWTIIFSHGEIRCYEGIGYRIREKKPDLSISATPQALLTMILKDDKTGLKMEGDAVLAQTLQQCFNYADLDWKKLFSDKLGESFGYPVFTLLRKSYEKIRQIHQRGKTQITDYLQEDMDYLPLPSEVDAFCEEVDELRLRVDRLEANLRNQP